MRRQAFLTDRLPRVRAQRRARELVQQKYARIAADFASGAADISSVLDEIVRALRAALHTPRARLQSMLHA